MEPQFIDRILTCSDCRGEFIFTAGEQLFFFDKQFKNDPKRCKPCKSRRSGLSAAAHGAGPAAAGLARTETRTQCSDCGIETTVPFKPTQGRPVLCRQCFQAKTRPAAPLAEAIQPNVLAAPSGLTASALAEVSAYGPGPMLSPDAAVVAAASMAAASPFSSVASAADLASISPVAISQIAIAGLEAGGTERALESRIPAVLVASNASEALLGDLRPVVAEPSDA